VLHQANWKRTTSSGTPRSQSFLLKNLTYLKTNGLKRVSLIDSCYFHSLTYGLPVCALDGTIFPTHRGSLTPVLASVRPYSIIKVVAAVFESNTGSIETPHDGLHNAVGGGAHMVCRSLVIKLTYLIFRDV
jgi:hypothetical protein